MYSFEAAQEIIRLAEEAVIDSKIVLSGRLRIVLHGYVLGPASFLTFGITSLVKQLCFGGAIFAGTLFFLDKSARQPQSVEVLNIWLAFLMALALVVLAVPSRCASNVKLVHVRRLIAGIHSVCETPASFDSARKALKVLESRCVERLSYIGWTMGVTWAGLWWFFNRSLASGSMSKDASTLFAWCVVYFLGAVAFLGYRAATKTLFQTIEFATIEVERSFAASYRSVKTDVAA